MPYAVTHFLLPVLLAALWRDYHLRKYEKRSFPLHYVLIAGLGGVLQDIDIIAYLFMQPLGFSYADIHRTITHSLLAVFFFVLLGLIFHRTKIKALGKHKTQTEHHVLGAVFRHRNSYFLRWSYHRRNYQSSLSLFTPNSLV